MVSPLQRAAASATEAAGAPQSCTHVEHEKKTFFSLLATTRSEDGGQGRALFARSSKRSGDP